MTEGPVFTSRLSGRPLLDSDGLAVGRIRDVVILPTAGGEPPWVTGLVVTWQRRQIFVNLGRVAEISIDGVHLRGGSVDLRRFSQRTGEILASGLYGQPAGTGTVLDVGIVPSEHRRGWEVSVLAVGQGRILGLGVRHHSTTIEPWDKYPELFKAGDLAEQLVQLREMSPTDLANAVEALPDSRRQQLADVLQDEQLADVLQEMPEQDQVRLLAGLGLERTADVVEEMDPDDAADLLAEMPSEQRERLLAAMETVQADDLRRLLRYGATTAGGLMTSQPLIVPPDAPVAEVLAHDPHPEVEATAAAQVYVCEPPTITPTGRFLGTVGFQELLREPPAATVGRVHRGQRLRPARALRQAGGPAHGRVQPDRRGRLRRRRPPARRDHRRRRPGPYPARRLAKEWRPHEYTDASGPPLLRRPIGPDRSPGHRAAHGRPVRRGRVRDGVGEGRPVPRHRPLPGRPDRVRRLLDHRSTPSGSSSTGIPIRSSCSTWPSPLQAAYAAPLILLAQNRQDDRDRASIERDREVAARTQADTEFLARELASVRLTLADVVTTQDLDDRLTRLELLMVSGKPPGPPPGRANSHRPQTDDD